MRRRDLLAVVVAAGGPFAALAQQPTKMPVIGVLGGFAPSASAQIESELAAFRQGLAETGYVAADQIRATDQPEDRHGARAHRSPAAARPGRRGHRMRRERRRR